MILELKIKNFLSFKDEVTFSFEATSDNTLDEYYVAEPVPGVRVLKMAMVYGANASGKSNLLKAFNFIYNFVHNIPKDSNESTDFIPFRFDNKNGNFGSFELVFYVKDAKHRYQLELDGEKVLKEVLYYYPGTQPAILFDRRYDNNKQLSIVNFGTKVKISEQAIEAIQLKTLKNMSVFGAFKQVNIDLPKLKRAYDWFSNQFNPIIDPHLSLTEYSDEKIKSNKQIKKQALEFINKADFNVSNVFYEEIIKNIPEELVKVIVNGPLSDDEKAQIIKEKAIHIENTIFEHKITKNNIIELHRLPEELESKGTLRFYGLSAPFFETIENDAFLPIDEIGTSLHPLLVMYFVREFLQKSRQAQLLFTTHNLSLLNEKDILRKDAIWFTDKGNDGVSSLYSLDEFPIRKELSYYNAYKQGKFGAIPNLEG